MYSGIHSTFIRQLAFEPSQLVLLGFCKAEEPLVALACMDVCYQTLVFSLLWAARYNTWLLINWMLKGVVFLFSFSVHCDLARWYFKHLSEIQVNNIWLTFVAGSP